MTTITRRQIRLEVGRAFKARDRDAFYEYKATAGATSSVTDSTRLASTRFTAQKFQDYWVRHSDATAAAPDGEKVYGRTLVASTGVLSVSPSFSVAPAANETGELWRDFDPDDVDRAIDRALSELCTRVRLTPLSWLANHDWLADALSATSATSWTASNATVLVTQESDAERFAERVVQVTNTGADGYLGQTVNNPYGASSGGEAQTWTLAALVQASGGTAALLVHDLTATANLTLTGTRTSWAGDGYQLLTCTFTTPATCETFSVRLSSAGAATVHTWGPVWCYPEGAREFVLPSRITARKFVGRFFALDGETWPERAPEPLCVQPHLYDVGGGQVIARFPQAVGTYRIVFEEYGTYPRFATIYDTQAARAAADALQTTCPMEYALWATVRELAGEEAAGKQWQRAKFRYRAPVRVGFGRDWR